MSIKACLQNPFLILVVCFFLSNHQAWGQFHINGSARKTDSICYQLTTANNGLVGSIWDSTKINLNLSFQAILDVFLGCDPTGADGIVFGFQPVSTSIGSMGEGIGFAGVSPSLGIELDTYQNGNLADPPYDHIAIIKNGDLNHNHANTIYGPKPFDHDGIKVPNIKDCKKHDLKVNWNADSMILDIFFDCYSIARYHGDIVHDIFGGNPLVYWGFTSATGGKNNEHDVCLKYTTFLDKLPDTVLCKGGALKLSAKGGASYLWTPSKGLDNPKIATPTARPDSTTQYIVTIKDNCQREFRDTQIVKIGGTPIESLHLGGDTLLCDKQTLRLNANVVQNANFLWSDKSTDSILVVTKPGEYAVTVTKASCTAHDSIHVKYLDHPVITFPSVVDTCLNKKVLLVATNPESRYVWQDGSTRQDYVVQTPGAYSVAVYNACGTAYGNFIVSYSDCHRIYLPNVFTPYATSEKNKTFYVQDVGDIKNVKLFMVFDRWGDMVFQARDIQPNDPALGWTGLNSPPGVYGYYVEMEFQDNETYYTKGDVTLLK